MLMHMGGLPLSERIQSRGGLGGGGSGGVGGEEGRLQSGCKINKLIFRKSSPVGKSNTNLLVLT